MPLNYRKSKEAFSENVAKERGAGKPIKQALAIAYAVQRGESKKPKHPRESQSALRTTRKKHSLAMHKLRAARTSRERAPHFAKFVD